LNILAFLGSPRAGGNTELLLNETLKAIDPTQHSIHIFRLNQMDMKPCQNCGGCDETGICVIQDSMGEIYDAIRKADRVILASPVFFFSLSAQTKIMIDRCQAFWCEKYVLKRSLSPGPFGRKGLLLLVGGMKSEIGVKCGDATAKAFFRSISVPEHETLSFLGVDSKGAIKDHPSALKQGFEAGLRLIHLDSPSQSNTNIY
jgi:multimeric flavodoxin WrbA